MSTLLLLGSSTPQSASVASIAVCYRHARIKIEIRHGKIEPVLRPASGQGGGLIIAATVSGNCRGPIRSVTKPLLPTATLPTATTVLEPPLASKTHGETFPGVSRPLLT